MTSMEPRMKAMQEMHQKMMYAKTVEERNALMADHMKAMQGGMGHDERHGRNGRQGPMNGMGAMADSKGMPADMAKQPHAQTPTPRSVHALEQQQARR